jgi:hypothetical protein
VDNTVTKAALRELTRIPGVGGKIAQELCSLGIRRVSDLRGRDPEELYERLCVQHGAHVDRCFLYVLRCAVYYASTDRPDAELLKWWNWKDDGGV